MMLPRKDSLGALGKWSEGASEPRRSGSECPTGIHWKIFCLCITAKYKSGQMQAFGRSIVNALQFLLAPGGSFQSLAPFAVFILLARQASAGGSIILHDGKLQSSLTCSYVCRRSVHGDTTITSEMTACPPLPRPMQPHHSFTLHSGASNASTTIRLTNPPRGSISVPNPLLQVNMGSRGEGPEDEIPFGLHAMAATAAALDMEPRLPVRCDMPSFMFWCIAMFKVCPGSRQTFYSLTFILHYDCMLPDKGGLICPSTSAW